jgi:hypothetical protein
MVLSVMSQWFGMSSEPESASSAPPTPAAAAAPRPLTIAAAGAPPPARRPLAKTKSDELLRDFESMRFLAAVDARLKVDRAALCAEDADRLEVLYAQAQHDGCEALLDILDHFETCWRRLRTDSRCGAGSSSAAVVVPHAGAA